MGGKHLADPPHCGGVDLAGVGASPHVIRSEYRGIHGPTVWSEVLGEHAFPIATLTFLHSFAMAPQLSIVVPVYNEAEIMPRALPSLLDDLDGTPYSYEVLVVENGSTDDTAKLAVELAGDRPVSVLSLDEPNYGGAIREGMLAATGTWSVVFDIDYTSMPFLDEVMASDDADIVLASKRNPDSVDRRPALRRLATAVFNLLLRVILSSKVSDTHGIKAFRLSSVSSLIDQVESRQDLFDTELVIRSERAGLRIREVPVVVEELRPARSSVLARAPRTILGLFRLRRRLSGEPTRQ
ncbi:MAG: glycosyltransferase [Acidimicrobiia bacterium]|nr:glycosyltransferase [Acidimicrobiia bacterium]